MKSRAVVVTGPRTVEIRELEVPAEPPIGGAIVRVLANGLCGSDYNLYNGRVSPVSEGLPLIPGHEMIVQIVEISPEAAATWRLEAGDRVAVKPGLPCGGCEHCRAGDFRFCARAWTYSGLSVNRDSGLWGGMSEYLVLAPGSQVYKVPDHVDEIDASLFNALSNAFEWTGRTGEAGVGERVLVLGAGQRGILSALVAHIAGAEQVILTGLDRDRVKLDLAPRFGATDVIHVEREDTVERVRELTGGRGVDLVVDTVPKATDPIQHGVDVLRPGGRLVLAGVKGHPMDGLLVDRIVAKALRLAGGLMTTDWADVRAIRTLAAARYPLKELHTHTFGLDEYESAVQLLGGETADGSAIHITIRP